MSLEQALNENTAAVTALTAALAKGVAPAAAAAPAAAGKPATKTAATKPAPKAPASVNTKEAMQALLNQVKEEKGGPVAKGIIADAGFQKMADISEDKYDEVFAACEAVLTPAAAGGDDDI